MKHIILASVLCVAAGCSQADYNKVTSALATPNGQLFCSVETAAGPLVFAAVNVATGGTAVIATGATAAFVDMACAAAKASIPTATGTPIPVSPPVDPDAAPRVAASVPAAP